MIPLLRKLRVHGIKELAQNSPESRDEAETKSWVCAAPLPCPMSPLLPGVRFSQRKPSLGIAKLTNAR